MCGFSPAGMLKISTVSPALPSRANCWGSWMTHESSSGGLVVIWSLGLHRGWLVQEMAMANTSTGTPEVRSAAGAASSIHTPPSSNPWKRFASAGRSIPSR